MKTDYGAISRLRVPWPLAYLGMSLVWGCTFLFIKLALGGFDPFEVTFGRMATGAVALVAACWLMRLPFPRDRMMWVHASVAGITLNALPIELYALAERTVSSVVAGIWNAAIPLLTVPLAVMAFRAEHIGAGKASGLAVGFLGIVLMALAAGSAGTSSFAGNVMCFAAAGCCAFGFVYSRRFLAGRKEAFALIAAVQLIAASVLTGTIMLTASTLAVHVSVAPVLAVVGLGVLCSSLGISLSLIVMRDAGAVTASTSAYLMPVVSTAAGALLLGERLILTQIAGAALIVGGLGLSQLSWWRGHLAAAKARSDLADPVRVEGAES